MDQVKVKFKDRLKDRYYLLMLCSVFVSVLWIYANLNTCFNLFDQLIMVIYAAGFMAIPVIIKHYSLLGGNV